MKLFYKDDDEKIMTDEIIEKKETINTIDYSSIVNDIKKTQIYNILHPNDLIPINKSIFEGFKIRTRIDGVTTTLYVKDIYSTQTDKYQNLIELKTILGDRLYIPKDNIIIQKTTFILYHYNNNSFQLFDLKINNIYNITINDIIDNTNKIIPQDTDNIIYISNVNKTNYIFNYLI